MPVRRDLRRVAVDVSLRPRGVHADARGFLPVRGNRQQQDLKGRTRETRSGSRHLHIICPDSCGSSARAPCAANAPHGVMRWHSREDDDRRAGRTRTAKRGPAIDRGGRSRVPHAGWRERTSTWGPGARPRPSALESCRSPHGHVVVLLPGRTGEPHHARSPTFAARPDFPAAAREWRSCDAAD